MLHVHCSVFLGGVSVPVMNSHSGASLCVTMEKKEKHMEREAKRIKGLWHRQTAQVN